MPGCFEAEAVVAACDDVGTARTDRWVDQDRKFGGEAFAEDLRKRHLYYRLLKRVTIHSRDEEEMTMDNSGGEVCVEVFSSRLSKACILRDLYFDFVRSKQRIWNRKSGQANSGA